jgi:predicted phosphohydrolase
VRIVVTADLHYDIARSAVPVRLVAEEICGLRADALLLLGDVAGRDIGIVNDCLHLFDSFAGRKLFVAGNHDIWAHPGEDSLDRLERALPEVCRDAGFHPLDLEPVVLDGVGIAGSMGWYDFSFRPRHLEIPLRFYEAKVSPGAAMRMERHSHLLADLSDVPPQSLEIGCRWMDGQHVRLPMSDAEFCSHLLKRLDAHLAELATRCKTIVVGLHHLPFAEFVPGTPRPAWAFAEAYLGSAAFGELLRSYPQVRFAFCGHSHLPGTLDDGRIRCVNVGCTYKAKRYEILDL